MEMLMRTNHQIVINWHVTEACNYRCQYCYAHWTRPDSSELWRDPVSCDALINELSQFFLADTTIWAKSHNIPARLNIAGGEPTLWQDTLLRTVNLGAENGFEISLISNGSRPKTLLAIAEKSSLLGISVDATDADRNARIGRADRKGIQIANSDLIKLVRDLRAKNPNLKIKINTVVNAENVSDDFSSFITAIAPDRWKILRMLPSYTDALAVDAEAFRRFVSRHRSVKPVPSVEDHEEMSRSYLMIDPHGRFFQNRPDGKGYDYSAPILEVGAAAAFSQIPFSLEKFQRRYRMSEVWA